MANGSWDVIKTVGESNPVIKGISNAATSVEFDKNMAEGIKGLFNNEDSGLKDDADKIKSSVDSQKVDPGLVKEIQKSN